MTKRKATREKSVASETDLALASGWLLEDRALRDLDLGELQWLRKEAALQNAEALEAKREDGGHIYGHRVEWHAATLAFLRMVDMEIRREMAYRRKQYQLALV